MPARCLAVCLLLLVACGGTSSTAPIPVPEGVGGSGNVAGTGAGASGTPGLSGTAGTGGAGGGPAGSGGAASGGAAGVGGIGGTGAASGGAGAVAGAGGSGVGGAGGCADGQKAASACAATLGKQMSAGFGRIDGTLEAIVRPEDKQCFMPNSTHVALDVKMGGSVYRLLARVYDDQAPGGLMYFAERDASLPAPPFSPGWHLGASFSYPQTLGVHAGAFSTATQAELISKMLCALTLGSPISVYATGYGPDGGHDVHRTNGAAADGAIVVHPDSATSHFMLFRFVNQTFLLWTGDFMPIRDSWAASCLLLGGLLASCSASSPPTADPAGAAGDSIGGSAGGGAAAGAGGTSGGGGATAGSGGTGATLGGGSGGAGGTAPSEIFAHTDKTLSKLDPNSSPITLTPIGDFDCVVSGKTTAMTDLAVNQQGALWGVSAHEVWPLTVTGGAVACGAPIHFADPAVKFYALTFAPVGVLDPAKEVLVAGNTAGELWSIDASGALAQRGTFGKVPANDGNGHKYSNPGKAWELSGDIVFLANGGKPVGFATVRDCPNPPSTTGCDAADTLLEIDVPKLATETTGSVVKAVRGQIATRAGCSDGKKSAYGSMFGIAAWGDKVYGFSRTGNLVEIATKDGSACLVQTYADAFSGAGVTTLAPVTPPDPK